MSGVEIRVRADSTQARRDLTNLERSVANIEKTTNRVTSAFQKLAVGISAAFTGSLATRGIIKASDDLINLENKIALVTGRGQELQYTLRGLYQAAASARQPVSSAASAFNKFGMSLQNAGYSTNELLIATESVLKAATISGASAESANAAIIQLGQGLAAGQLRGEELNSVLEQMPRVAKAIADEMGVAQGALKGLAEEGKITADIVMNAMLNGAMAIDAEFAVLQSTVSGLTTVLRDEFTRALSVLDREFGFSEVIKSNIVVATFALRNFSDYLPIWVDTLQYHLTVAVDEFYWFKYRATNVLKDLFDVNFTPDRMVESIISALESAKQKVSNAFKDGFDIVINTIDLSEYITGIDDTISTLKTFASNVISVFYGLWKRLVGNTLWWGTFDKDHEEGGAGAVGNTTKLLSAISPVIETLSRWKDSVVGVFETLHREITSAWDRLTRIFFKEIPQPGGMTSLEPVGLLKAFIDIGKTGEEYIGAVETKFLDLRSTVDDISSRVRGFFRLYEVESTLGLNNQIDYKLTPFGKLVETLSILTGVEFSKLSFSDAFSKSVDYLYELFNSGGSSLLQGKLGTASSIGALATSLSDKLREGKLIASGFIKEVLSDARKLGGAISVALLAKTALGLSFKGLAISITGLLISADVLNSPEFLASLETLAFGIGDFLSSLLSDDKVGNSIVEGISKAILAIGKGIYEGFTGEEVPTEFGAKVIGGIASAIALAAFGPARKLLLGIPQQLIRLMFGSNENGIFKAITGWINNAAPRNLWTQLGKGTWGGLGGFLGTILARGIQGGVRGYFAAEGTNLLLDMLFEGMTGREASGLESGIMDIISSGVGGAVAGAAVGGPWGALIVGLGAALYTAVTNPEVINAISALPQLILDGLANLGSWIVEKVNEATTGVKTWLVEFKDNFLNSLTDAWNEFWGLNSEPKEIDVQFNTGAFPTLTADLPRIQTVTPQSDGVSSNSQAITDIERYLEEQGYPVKRASGGYISGSGGPTDDKIPAMLSNGEYVIKASTVDKFGVGFLNALNNGQIPQFRADGGWVTNRPTGVSENEEWSRVRSKVFPDEGPNDFIDNSLRYSNFGNEDYYSVQAYYRSAYDSLKSLLLNKDELLSTGVLSFPDFRGDFFNGLDNAVGFDFQLPTTFGFTAGMSIVDAWKNWAKDNSPVSYDGSILAQAAYPANIGFGSLSDGNARELADRADAAVTARTYGLLSSKVLDDFINEWTYNKPDVLGNQDTVETVSGGYSKDQLLNHLESEVTKVSSAFNAAGQTLEVMRGANLPDYNASFFTNGEEAELRFASFVTDDPYKFVGSYRAALHEIGHAWDYLDETQHISDAAARKDSFQSAIDDFAKRLLNETQANAYERSVSLVDSSLVPWATAVSQGSYLNWGLEGALEQNPNFLEDYPQVLGVLGVSDNLGLQDVLLQTTARDMGYAPSDTAFLTQTVLDSAVYKAVLDGIISGYSYEIEDIFAANAVHRATGGAIYGAGGPTDDKIPAMLSNGEFVMQASAVDRFGLGFMSLLNKGIMPEFFSLGGYPGQSELDDLYTRLEAWRGLERRGEPNADAAIANLTSRIADHEAAKIAWDASHNDGSLGDNGGELTNVNAATSGTDGTREKTYAENMAEGFRDDIKGALERALVTGNFKEFLSSVMDSLTSRIITTFVDNFVNSIFDGFIGSTFEKMFDGLTEWSKGLGEKTQAKITDGLGETASGNFFADIFDIFKGVAGAIGDLISGAFGGGGGGGFFSAIAGLFGGGAQAAHAGGVIRGFATGGVVPMYNGAQMGKDSVPAILAPGEYVLPSQRAAELFKKQAGAAQQQTVVNLNVTGDISRQTKQEILRMIPQITAGVNMTNREQG